MVDKRALAFLTVLDVRINKKQNSYRLHIARSFTVIYNSQPLLPVFLVIRSQFHMAPPWPAGAPWTVCRRSPPGISRNNTRG